MDVTSTFLSVTVVLICCILPLASYIILSWIFRKSHKNLPPGPRDWRTHWKLLKASWDGTLPQLVGELARKYGPITLVPTLGKPLVLLNTAEISRKLLASNDYKFLVADRMDNAAFRLAGLKGKNMLFCKYDGELTYHYIIIISNIMLKSLAICMEDCAFSTPPRFRNFRYIFAIVKGLLKLSRLYIFHNNRT